MNYRSPIRRRELLLLLPSLVLAQRRSGGTHGGSGRNPSGLPPDQIRAAVAEFQGVLRNFDKKKIVIETTDGQTLIFQRTKSTEFLGSDGKKGLDLGISVQVEAHKDNTGELAAVRVCEHTCKSNPH